MAFLKGISLQQPRPSKSHKNKPRGAVKSMNGVRRTICFFAPRVKFEIENREIGMEDARGSVINRDANIAGCGGENRAGFTSSESSKCTNNEQTDRI